MAEMCLVKEASMQRRPEMKKRNVFSSSMIMQLKEKYHEAGLKLMQPKCKCRKSHGLVA